MGAGWDSRPLLEPVSEEQPCGVDLEDTELLTSFDTYRLFGQSRPLDAPVEPDEKRVPKPAESPEWVEIRDKALDALKKSKDLRLLATAATALLRTDGVPAFSDTLDVASHWLATYWTEAYPRVDEDVIFRRNALNYFADPMAVIDGLRRTPLVRSRQHGTFTLRDIDIATRRQAPGESDTPVDERQIDAAFASLPIADLTALHDHVANARASVQQIDRVMREAAGAEAAPTFEALTAVLDRMGQTLRAELAAHPDRTAAGAADAGGAPAAAEGAAPVGVVGSRQDAIRALDAVADFFKRTEPSSPIPMFLARAKRLVAKDFLEVLADIAPEAVPQARAAGGLKEQAE